MAAQANKKKQRTDSTAIEVPEVTDFKSFLQRLDISAKDSNKILNLTLIGSRAYGNQTAASDRYTSLFLNRSIPSTRTVI